MYLLRWRKENVCEFQEHYNCDFGCFGRVKEFCGFLERLFGGPLMIVGMDLFRFPPLCIESMLARAFFAKLAFFHFVHIAKFLTTS